jgi:hypothetical protein
MEIRWTEKKRKKTLGLSVKILSRGFQSDDKLHEFGEVRLPRLG